MATCLIVVIGVLLSASGAFAMVTHRMFWQKPSESTESERPATGAVLCGIGSTMTLISLGDNLFPSSLRWFVYAAALPMLAAVGYFLRRAERSVNAR